MRVLEDITDNPRRTTPTRAEAVPLPSAPVAVAQPLDTTSVKLTSNLSEENSAMQQRSIERLKEDPHAFVSRYRSEFKDHYNPDNAAELFSEYCSSPENRAKYRIAVAGAAGWVSDQAFRQRLSEPDDTPVLFTAGGTASGKSTIAGPAAEAGLIVFDSTFSNTELSKRRLQEALGSGRKVEVCYVYRDPAEAWIAAGERTKEEAAGRTVTTQAHASTHQGAAKTVAQLTADFSGNPRVEFRYFENSTANGLWPGGLELTGKSEHTSLGESALQNMMPSKLARMLPKLAQEHLARLSRVELTDYVERIAVAAVGLCRKNKDIFLKQYPRLDFRNRK